MASKGGLVNMGMTCYANSVFQAIRHCSKIPWIFEEGRYNTLFHKEASSKREKQQILTATFANVIQLLQKCNTGQVVRPADFWNKFGPCVQDTIFEQLKMRMCHDAHEFYICLLDIIHEALSQETDMRITRPEPTTGADRRAIKALDTWRIQFTKQYSPLVDLFYGLQHIVVRCKGCGNCSHRWETFTSLKATIPQVTSAPPSLLDMLKEEYKPETINDYDCEKCRPARQEAEQTTYIWRMPHYLTFVVKRFTHTGGRINTPVAALPGQGEEPISFEAFFSEESPEKVGNNKYRLHSIVDHHGSAGGGHYIAQCRSVTDPTKWNIYDDNSVHDIKAPMFGSQTYMLWFERYSPPSI
jgi:ubiquitin C-terminal hydrolase